MNDQWSGKTLFSASSANAPAPSRSSIARAIRLSTTTAPESGTYRLGKVPEGDEVSLGVDPDRQLWERTRSRATARGGPVEHVEHRLMTGAEQLARFRLVEPDRTSCMRADLRERDQPLVARICRTGWLVGLRQTDDER